MGAVSRVTGLGGLAGLVTFAVLLVPPGPTGTAASLVVGTASAPAGGHAVDPAMFEPGSCRSFGPTAGNRHESVFLDAGHGSIDPGSAGVTESGQTIYEATETLAVELDALALLRSAGFTVTVSRTGDSPVARPQPGDVSDGLYTIAGDLRDVASRDICADMAKADILVGIYFDAGSSPSNAGSITGYDADRPFADDNLRLATLLQTDVVAAMDAQGWDVPDDGVVSDTLLGGPALSDAAAAYGHLLLLGPADPGYFSTPSTMPGALIEPLFITDPYEGSLANSARGQQVIADGLTAAVEQYFGPPKESGHPQKKPSASHRATAEKTGSGSRRKGTKS
ncbi:MAG: N-acetylmuramoyl-L-alanine amidase [Acidimicrobiales bacterium]